MKISELLARRRPMLSFEVFPPKQNAAFEPIKAAVAELCALKPAFTSVTYGAAGSANVNTLSIAKYVQSFGVPALAHLTSITSDRDRIADEIKAFRAAQAEV